MEEAVQSCGLAIEEAGSCLRLEAGTRRKGEPAQTFSGSDHNPDWARRCRDYCVATLLKDLKKMQTALTKVLVLPISWRNLDGWPDEIDRR